MTQDLQIAAEPQATGLRLNPVPAFSRSQSAYLDLLRGTAAQLVLLHHAVGYCLPNSGLAELGGGALGVLTFFLLSGFLITDTIQSRLAARRFSLTEFLVSRFSRIYTPYIPAIGLVAVLDHFIVGSPAYEYAADYRWATAIANLFMLQDYPVFQILRRLHVPEQDWFFRTFGSGRQFWTVSIEWWIYLTVGIATALMLRRPPQRLLWVLLAIVAVEPTYHLVAGPGDSLALAWLFGGAASLIRRRVVAGTGSRIALLLKARLVLIWFLLFGLTVMRLLFTHGRIYDAVFALLLAGLLFVPLLMPANSRPPAQTRRFRLGILSFHSYSLYLTHGSLILLLVTRYGDAVLGWQGMALLAVACNLAAMAFALVFELPHRRVRRAILHGLSYLRMPTHSQITSR